MNFRTLKYPNLRKQKEVPSCTGNRAAFWGSFEAMQTLMTVLSRVTYSLYIYIYIYIYIHIHIRVQHSCSGSPTKRLGCNNSAHATVMVSRIFCLSGQRVIAGEMPLHLFLQTSFSESSRILEL